MRVAIIPARGGSKRIPRKNLRDFGGKPIMAWSIETALQSGCFDHVVVSTDDDEIATVAERHGATVPFRRPGELADDHAATRPVVNHAIEQISRLHGQPDQVCCIYPTAPFLSSEDLADSLSLLQTSDVEFVFSCGTFAYPIQRAFILDEFGGPQRLHPEHRFTRSQDLPETYHDAGQFYWGRTEAFLTGLDPMAGRSKVYVLPRHRVHDIDTEEDWQLALMVFQALRAGADCR